MNTNHVSHFKLFRFCMNSEYVEIAVRHVMMRQGILGVKVAIMLPHAPKGIQGPKSLLSDVITILEPKGDDACKNYVYTLIYSASGAKILLFKKSTFSNWFVERHILKGFSECGFYVNNVNSQVNTILHGQGYKNKKSAGTWVFPGGSDDGKGTQYSYDELEQETGLYMRKYPANVFQPSGKNYSVTLIEVSESNLEDLCTKANRNFQECDNYRRKLNGLNFDIAQKTVRAGFLPPLSSDELCACEIFALADAVKTLKNQENCDWFLDALDYMAAIIATKKETGGPPNAK